jgi:hypothetical protein
MHVAITAARLAAAAAGRYCCCCCCLQVPSISRAIPLCGVVVSRARLPGQTDKTVQLRPTPQSHREHHPIRGLTRSSQQLCSTSHADCPAHVLSNNCAAASLSTRPLFPAHGRETRARSPLRCHRLSRHRLPSIASSRSRPAPAASQLSTPPCDPLPKVICICLALRFPCHDPSPSTPLRRVHSEHPRRRPRPYPATEGIENLQSRPRDHCCHGRHARPLASAEQHLGGHHLLATATSLDTTRPNGTLPRLARHPSHSQSTPAEPISILALSPPIEQRVQYAQRTSNDASSLAPDCHAPNRSPLPLAHPSTARTAVLSTSLAQTHPKSIPNTRRFILVLRSPQRVRHFGGRRVRIDTQGWRWTCTYYSSFQFA